MHRLIKATCAIAAEDIGKARAERIAAKAQKRYEELCWENASDSKALRAHTYARIYPAIAVYEVLRSDGVGQERAVWVIREYFRRFSARFVPHLQRARTEERSPVLAYLIPVRSVFFKNGAKTARQQPT
jgi:hypothetical protein